MGRIEPTSQTFAWKKYRVQTLIEVLGNELNRASMMAETTHHFKFGESLQTTDEIKVNMPHRSPFITVETLCCLLVKLCPFYNNYSRLVATMISSVLVTAHDLCMRNQGLCHSSVIVLSSEFSSDALTRLSKMDWYSPTRSSPLPYFNRPTGLAPGAPIHLAEDR